MAAKVAIAINTAWNIYNFRAGLIRALIAHGFEVVAIAPPDNYVPRVEALGCRFVALPMDNKGTHPGRDLLLLRNFYRILRDERPGVFLGYTVKPNIYGSLAAHALRIPVINNIAGLGAVFIKQRLLTRLVRLLYRLAMRRSYSVLFQNEDDRTIFVNGNLVRLEVADRIPGSGIDPEKFPYTAAAPLDGRRFRFLLIARMLWDKGVGEYVQAARRVRQRYSDVEFHLLGPVDVQNPAAIPRQQIESWTAEGLVNYLGVTDDVKSHIACSDCVVLPSYREGLPRTLLEAIATGRPIITTDTAGCRDVVESEVNGYLCRTGDPEDLARAMEKMISLSDDARRNMGRHGREKAEREFDERIVIDRYLTIIQKAIAESKKDAA